jgi:hypothetical protein
METFSQMWQYLAEFFLEWETFHIKVVERIKTHILCSVTFFKSCSVYEIMSKIVVEPERPQTTSQYGAKTVGWVITVAAPGKNREL